MAYQERDRNGEPIIFHVKSHAITVAGKRMEIHRAAFAVLFVAAKARKERWTSPYDNQIPGLTGRVLAYDMRYGLDHNLEPKTSEARETVGQLFSDRWEGTPFEDRPDEPPENFIAQTANTAPPETGDKEGRTPFTEALSDLNRELKKHAESNYLPEALQKIKHEVVRKKIQLDDGFEMSMNHFGLDFDPGRIEFRDD